MSDILIFLVGLIDRIIERLPQWISLYLLFLTLIAILWYSYETRGLKKQMVLQNVLSLRPHLILYEIPQAGRFLYRVKNIGNGAALDIRIEDRAFELPGPGEKMIIFYRFECQNILEINEERQLIIKAGDRDEPTKASTAELAQLERHTFELTLSYKNVHGQEYSDTGRLGKGMLQRESS